MPFPITKQYIAVEQPDKVLISGEGAKALINSLIQKPAITLVELVKSGAVINLSAIAVDDNGRVVITQKEFKDAIEARMSQAVAAGGAEVSFIDTNCSCNV